MVFASTALALVGFQLSGTVKLCKGSLTVLLGTLALGAGTTCSTDVKTVVTVTRTDSGQRIGHDVT